MFKKILCLSVMFFVAIIFLFQGEVRAEVATLSPATIKVLTPNGGEYLKAGETYKITWNSDLLSNTQSTKIYLVNDLEDIVACTTSDICSYTCTSWKLIASLTALPSTSFVHEYSWKIPDDQELGAKYKIFVRTTSASVSSPTSDSVSYSNFNPSSCISDFSDNYFSIASNDPVVISDAWDIDNDGQVGVSTDGVLAQRYLFGFTGDSLIKDAIGVNATRKTAAEIENHLACYKKLNILDIDGDGRSDALSDGILIMRYISGYQGQELINDAISPNATRTSAEEILEFLINSPNWEICSDDGESPVITGLSGPTNLKVDQTGTWKITASDPDGDYLSYLVSWGEAIFNDKISVTPTNSSQSTTFSHSYSSIGDYTVSVKVTDAQGLTATSAITVQIEDEISSCAKEGEKFSKVFTNDYLESCCLGLIEWESGMDTRKVENGECVETGLVSGSPVGTCLNCGNGICEQNENICNCSEDCKLDVICATDLKICSNGIGVGRTGPNCEFVCPDNPPDVICATDLKICPNGIGVGRTGPNCEFVCLNDETTYSTPIAGYEEEVITNPTAESNPFADVSLGSTEGKAAVELYRRGVIGGFSDGEFKGKQPVNRAEAAKFLLLARGIEVGNLSNDNKFRDVKNGEWYEKFVMKAAEKGIISGYPDGDFKPADTVNTVEFLKMMTKTFDLPALKHPYYDVPDNAWYMSFVSIAAPNISWSEYQNGYDLFPETRSTHRIQPDRNLTRNEVAVAIYQYLKNR